MKVNREYKVGPWRSIWIGKESVDNEIDLFVVHNGKEFFTVRTEKIADILQATFNLMEVEDAELQTPVDGSSAEGSVTG